MYTYLPFIVCTECHIAHMKTKFFPSFPHNIHVSGPDVRGRGSVVQRILNLSTGKTGQFGQNDTAGSCRPSDEVMKLQTII